MAVIDAPYLGWSQSEFDGDDDDWRQLSMRRLSVAEFCVIDCKDFNSIRIVDCSW